MADLGRGHWPVMPRETVELLSPAGRRILLDCTLGLGGHAEVMLSAAGDQAQLIGVDVDERNLLIARERLGRFVPRVRLFRANFSELIEVLRAAGVQACDAVLADLGVSSNQLDDPMRGLSFQVDGPLDMRLDDRESRTATDLVNRLGETELADLIYRYGEERYSRRIARAIVENRRQQPIRRTEELSRIVTQAYPAATRRSRKGVHPATRTFQALRIAVNDELGNLERLLEVLPKILAPGARAAIISFHSLEDRLVKQSFSAWAAAGRAKLLNRKPLTAGDNEMDNNPRSRSAKLRGIEWNA
jgi:16S rRNA (cytosine1402-N4)-methyltransferase